MPLSLVSEIICIFAAEFNKKKYSHGINSNIESKPQKRNGT